MKSYLLAAAMVSTAFAACPNSCSGHGTCNTMDQCTCFLEWAGNATETDAAGKEQFRGISVEREWRGADCSRRTCPRGISWSASYTLDPDGNDADDKALMCRHQDEVECSDQGKCDRATGMCACFPGYDGSACQRTTCPDDCSGHGTCRSNQDFAYDYAITKTEQLLQPGQGVDGNQGSTERFEQNYRVTYDNAWDSGMHYGCLCDAGYRGPSCALVECPSSKDPLDDKCDTSTAITDYQLQYDAPFGATGWEHAYSYGAAADGKTEGKIGENQESKNTDYNKFYILNDNGRKVYGCYGAMSGQDCSGRGICDYTTGTCKCFSGYAGTACEGVEEMA